MAYNPELAKHLLGEQVAELFDGTITIEPSDGKCLVNLKVGDKLTFRFKEPAKEARQFIVSWKK